MGTSEWIPLGTRRDRDARGLRRIQRPRFVRASWSPAERREWRRTRRVDPTYRGDMLGPVPIPPPQRVDGFATDTWRISNELPSGVIGRAGRAMDAIGKTTLTDERRGVVTGITHYGFQRVSLELEVTRDGNGSVIIVQAHGDDWFGKGAAEGIRRFQAAFEGRGSGALRTNVLRAILLTAFAILLSAELIALTKTGVPQDIAVFLLIGTGIALVVLAQVRWRRATRPR